MALHPYHIFKWSERQYTLEELAARYRDLFPFPVLVTNGYLPNGKVEWSASAEEVFWAHAVVQNQYIVVQDKDKNRFKIPRSYEAMVIPIMADGKEGQAFPFHEVRDRGEYKYIRFVDRRRELVTDVSMERRYHVFGELTVIDVSEADCIAFHPMTMECASSASDLVNNEILSEAFNIIPVNVPIMVSIGVALDRASDVIFFHTMAELKALVDSYGHSYQTNMKSVSVIVHETKPRLSSEYEYVDLEEERKNHCQKNSVGASDSGTLPGVPCSCIDPETRLRELRRFYETEQMDSGGSNLSYLDYGEYLQPVPCRAPVDNVSTSTITHSHVRPTEVDDCPGQGVSLLKQRFEEAIREKSRNSEASSDSGQSATWRQNRTLTKPNPVVSSSSVLKHGKTISPPITPPSGEQPFVRVATPLAFVATGQPSSSRPVRTAMVSPMRERKADDELSIQKTASRLTSPVHINHVEPVKSFQNKRKRILRVEDIPQDISALSVDEMMDCLTCLNLDDHVGTMRRGMVDGSLLLCLDEQNLINDFGFSTFNAAKLMQFAKHGWRPKI